MFYAPVLDYALLSSLICNVDATFIVSSLSTQPGYLYERGLKVEALCDI